MTSSASTASVNTRGAVLQYALAVSRVSREQQRKCASVGFPFGQKRRMALQYLGHCLYSVLCMSR